MIDLRDLRVRDVMSEAPQCLEASCKPSCAYHLFLGQRLSGAPVLGSEGELVGVLTQGDLLAHAASRLGAAKGAPSPEEWAGLDDVTVAELMSPEPVTCEDSVPLVEACQQMVQSRLHRLVVTSFGVPLGVLSAIDVVRAVACLGNPATAGSGCLGSDEEEEE